MLRFVTRGRGSGFYFFACHPDRFIACLRQVDDQETKLHFMHTLPHCKCTIMYSSCRELSCTPSTSLAAGSTQQAAQRVVCLHHAHQVRTSDTIVAPKDKDAAERPRKQRNAIGSNQTLAPNPNAKRASRPACHKSRPTAPGADAASYGMELSAACSRIAHHRFSQASDTEGGRMQTDAAKQQKP